ncbi:sulfite exporter TauE/SafE family protein [Stappia sp.]|jgi:uncharacterized membrane protein YfcA|uniref:sulfite exporter TauE/SafE family protein n=1 Tax=Stappia sp. TaxID=1870903 RepID=UPI003A991980
MDAFLAALTQALLAPDVSPLVQLGLVLVSFLTSAVSAAFGLGGGVMLIGIMALVMPIAALVPVHGMVQLGSNAGRAAVLLGHVNWTAALWFLAGAVLGAIAGGAVAINLPGAVIRLALGLFILWMVWGRPPRFANTPKRAMAGAGFIATALSMIFGATGPIGGAVLAALGLTRKSFVATQAVTALCMHVLKIAVFGALGFAFAPWAGLIVLMIASGFLGTLAGTRLLSDMPEKAFRTGFRVIMSALALTLIWRGAEALLS